MKLVNKQHGFHQVLLMLVAVGLITGLLGYVAYNKISDAASSTSTNAAIRSLENGPNTGSHAVLTYDDCTYGPWVGVGHRNTTPNGRTTKAALTNYLRTIDELVKLKAAVVIAPTGLCIEMFKKYLKTDITYYARTHGQYVMSHTYSHRYLSQLSKKDIRWQVNHGVDSYWVRPPYGDVSLSVNQVLKSMDRKAWTWTWSSADWQGHSQKKVVDSTVQNCLTGSTCLMHLHASGFSPKAMRQTIKGMRAKGTKVCGLQVNKAGKPIATAVKWKKLKCA